MRLLQFPSTARRPYGNRGSAIWFGPGPRSAAQLGAFPGIRVCAAWAWPIWIWWKMYRTSAAFMWKPVPGDAWAAAITTKMDIAIRVTSSNAEVLVISTKLLISFDFITSSFISILLHNLDGGTKCSAQLPATNRRF